MTRRRFFGLIRHMDWVDGYAVFRWWNWLGLAFAAIGIATLHYMQSNQATLRLSLGSWLDPIFWMTFVLTLICIAFCSRWTTAEKTH
jgi:hypothetical protein